ncbi:MAG: hypothetical protein M1834_000683 [Cirrosporium novae-zelandiae]|nr:MAG: hypothetical protein M1834_000683 [Cirrosporium novae-zelandiae]
MEHLNNKTPFIYAHILSETQLQSRPLKETCVDHVHGFCTKGTQCAQDHGLHRVDEMPWKEGKPQVLGRNGQVNTLLRSSAVPHHQSIDLPGRYSCSGPRHNNDHENYRRINILPTVDEILSDQGPWVPQKDMTSVHHLPLGPERSLDIQFRQFRYDSTTGLICACRAVAQTLAYGHDEHYPKFNLNTNGGQQYSIFSGVRLEGLNFEEKKGISISISFSCPASWKGKSTKAIGHFQTGMLCALVGIDGDSNSLWVTFLDVQSNYTTGAMDRRYRAQGKRPEGVRAGLDLTFADPENMDDVRRMLYYHKGILQGRFLLVEFSKLLLGGFSSCLKRLQQLDSDSLAFSQQVAPKKPDDVLSNLSPPKYALEKDFKFNLKPLGCDKKMSLEEIDKMTEVLKSETTLDDGQAEALSNSLQHSFAFTQGPPGTGKSYLGVSLAQVLNASHFPNKAKPLLVVCVTNHALDDFLDSLRSAGFTKMARLGGGSKEAWTQAYSLYHISKSSGLVKTREENRACARARDNFETLFRDGYQWCEAFNEAGGGMPAWVTVQEHLREKHPHIHMQFCSTPYAGSETSSDTLKLARKSEGFIYKYWARGGDLRSINSLQSDFAKFLGTNSNSGLESEEVNTTSISDLTRQLLEDLHDKARTLSENSRENIWAFSQDERHELMAQWRFEVREEMLLDQLAEVQHRFWRARQNKFNAFNAFDSRCLAQQQVIGVTTTGCAQFWPMLRDIGFEVVICEEAGEVPESHTLCTLFPTVQHAIFIGDPKQLRPQVNDPSMSMEEAHGTLYRLDESLFERLTFPTDPSMVNFSMPMSHLTVQRRMHPVISMIPKAILYPFLKNHESTYQHPPVSGILNRMFWLDHQQPENDLDFTSPYSKSYSNSFEVEWIAEMVDYLVSSHHYSHEDIAVLTPYNGQLQALKQRLESRCKIMLSEKDRDALLDKSSLLPEELKPNGELTDVQLGSMLRLATIDNFQGEEAKVVILSLVRSNKDGKLGFVKSLNRINVACSRARNGFYIIGNSSILQRDPTWKEVIGVFKSTNRLGPTLTTCSQGVVVFVELGFLAAIYAGGLATQKLSMIHGNAKRNALKSIVADTSVITAAAILVVNAVILKLLPSKNVATKLTFLVINDI